MVPHPLHCKVPPLHGFPHHWPASLWGTTFNSQKTRHTVWSALSQIVWSNRMWWVQSARDWINGVGPRRSRDYWNQFGGVSERGGGWYKRKRWRRSVVSTVAPNWLALFEGLICTSISARPSVIKVINRDALVRLFRVDTIANLMLLAFPEWPDNHQRFISALFCKNVTDANHFTLYYLISVARYFGKIKIVQCHFTWSAVSGGK